MIARFTRYLWLLRHPYAGHLLHRRCRPCWSNGHEAGYQAGHAAGFLEAARLSELRDRCWKAGIDPDQLEQYIRRAA